MAHIASPAAIAFCLLLTAPVSIPAQQAQTNPVCKASVISVLKPLPELQYECDSESGNDFDARILKRPERTAALRKVISSLEAIDGDSWWETEVSDLNACEFRHEAGTLSDEETERFRGGDYQVRLFGDRETRLVVLTDPCYQTGFGGSALFLMHRSAGKVYATLAIDGYYTRADNSVGLEFGQLNGEQIIEISTGTGGLHPYLSNYYFSIDRRTKRAVPRKIFKVQNRLTNKITSTMLFEGPEDSSDSQGELKIIVKGKLAPSFSSYAESERGRIDDGGRKLARRVYRWNGMFYSVR